MSDIITLFQSKIIVSDLKAPYIEGAIFDKGNPIILYIETALFPTFTTSSIMNYATIENNFFNLPILLKGKQKFSVKTYVVSDSFDQQKLGFSVNFGYQKKFLFSPQSLIGEDSYILFTFSKKMEIHGLKGSYQNIVKRIRSDYENKAVSMKTQPTPAFDEWHPLKIKNCEKGEYFIFEGCFSGQASTAIILDLGSYISNISQQSLREIQFRRTREPMGFSISQTTLKPHAVEIMQDKKKYDFMRRFSFDNGQSVEMSLGLNAFLGSEQYEMCLLLPCYGNNHPVFVARLSH